jgi:hypothetical protein
MGYDCNDARWECMAYIYPFADDDEAFGWRLWSFFWDGKLDLILGVFVCCEVFGIWCIRKCYMHHLQLVKKLIAFVVSVFFFLVCSGDLGSVKKTKCMLPQPDIFTSALAVIYNLSGQMAIIEVCDMAPMSIVRDEPTPRNHTASFRDPHWSTNGT